MLRAMTLVAGCVLVACNILSFLAARIMAVAREPRAEYPVSGATALATADGIAALALPIFSRVQLYDSAGNFLRGVHIAADGGDFRLWSDGGEFVVATARNAQLLHLTPNGVIRAATAAEASYFQYPNSLSGTLGNAELVLAPSPLSGATISLQAATKTRPFVAQPALVPFLGLHTQQVATAAAGLVLLFAAKRRTPTPQS